METAESDIKTESTVIETENTVIKSVCERCPPHIHIRGKNKKVTEAEALRLWKVFLEKKKRVHPTLESQFRAFATMVDSRRDGRSINLFRSDYWFKQAKILDHKTVTMLNTSDTFKKYIVKQETIPPLKDKKKQKKAKSKKLAPEDQPIPPDELTYKQWLKHVRRLCKIKHLDEELIREMLRTCGLPNGEPWQDSPKKEPEQERSSIISITPENFKCICERLSAELDPYIHLPPPESMFIIQE